MAISMLAYKEGSPPEFRSAYQKLWRAHKIGFASFSALDTHMDRITQGRFLVLHRRFKLKTLVLLRDGEPRLMATLFDPNPGWPGIKYPASIGAICAAADLDEDEAWFFWAMVADRHADLNPIGPLNGHSYLGFALPPPEAEGKHVGFQIGAPHRLQEVIFGPFRGRPSYRRHYTFETDVTPELVDKLRADLARPPRLPITMRRFNRWRAKRDLTDLNRIVNRAFINHFDFAPLTDEENWDILRYSVPLMRADDFLFVEHKRRPVGFCFGTRDYNRILRNDSDLRNVARLILPRRRWSRARLIYKGVLPEFTGLGLVNQARHRIMLTYASEGVRTIENSYIDEGNANSLKNVRATKAKLLYEYHLHRLAEEVPRSFLKCAAETSGLPELGLHPAVPI